MQDRIGMGARGVVIRYVAVEDEGEDEGGGTIADNGSVDVGWDRPESHMVQGGGRWTFMKKEEQSPLL